MEHAIEVIRHLKEVRGDDAFMLQLGVALAICLMIAFIEDHWPQRWRR